MLLRPDVVVLEMGDLDGVLYGEDLRPGQMGTVHIAVFNRRAVKDLDAMLTATAAWAISTFQLAGLNTWVPAHNKLALRLMDRLDWHLDGIIRRLMIFDGVPTDAFVYSLLADEVR